VIGTINPPTPSAISSRSVRAAASSRAGSIVSPASSAA
jgi:hypothetical protein